MTGIIYCLENTEMPDVVKIGQTTDIEQRLRQLDNTSVPVPFVCVLALEVENHTEAERLLHDAFHDQRVRRSREFFRVSAQRVIAAMRLTQGRDVTPQSDVVEDEESGAALDDSRKRRARFNFDMVGITPGTTLHFRDTADAELNDEPGITAVVVSRNRIMFEDEQTSLTAAANKILERMGKSRVWSSVPHLWYVGDESLGDRRERMEQEDD